MSKIADVKAALSAVSADWQLVASLNQGETPIATFTADADATFAMVARENLGALVALYDAVKAQQASQQAVAAAVAALDA